jgi:hypothetical protein
VDRFFSLHENDPRKGTKSNKTHGRMNPFLLRVKKFLVRRRFPGNGASEQSPGADGAIVCLSSNLLLRQLDADRAPQLKAVVSPLRVIYLMSETGVRISVIYTDEHLIELRVNASNGVFAGQADVYADSEAPSELAAVLRGFPKSQDDVREFELGSFDAAYAGGGAGCRFYCLDSVGHAATEVRLRTDPNVESGVSDLAVFHISVEAAAVDSFVTELERMAAAVGQAAILGAAA